MNKKKTFFLLTSIQFNYYYLITTLLFIFINYKLFKDYKRFVLKRRSYPISTKRIMIDNKFIQ